MREFECLVCEKPLPLGQATTVDDLKARLVAHLYTVHTDKDHHWPQNSQLLIEVKVESQHFWFFKGHAKPVARDWQVTS